MTTWASTFDEAAGTVVQDCGVPAEYWTNAADATYWWETDGLGHLTGGTGNVLNNNLYHVASSADQSVTLVFERTSNSSKHPQIGLRHTNTPNTGDLRATGVCCLVYASGSWRINSGWRVVASVADADYAVGTDDPDGDEVRTIEASFVGSTFTLTVHKGSGELVGTASAEIPTVTDPGNIVVLLNGSYSGSGDLTNFGMIDSMTAEDGVGAVVYDVSTIPEGVNFSDQLDSSIVISESINDGVYFNDSFSFGGTVIQISITEGLNIYGQPSGNLLFDLLAAGGITVSDTPTGVYLIALDLADGITVSDTLKAGFTFDLKVTDGLTISDLVSFIGQAAGRRLYLVFSSKAAKIEFESKMATITFTVQ